MLKIKQTHLSFRPVLKNSNEAGFLSCTYLKSLKYLFKYIKGTTKDVFEYIYNKSQMNGHNANMYLDVSYNEIASELYLSIDTVEYHVKKLIKMNLIFIRQQLKKAKGYSNGYKINFDMLEKMYEEWVQDKYGIKGGKIPPHSEKAINSNTSTVSSDSSNLSENLRGGKFPYYKEYINNNNKQYSITTSTNDEKNTVQYSFSNNTKLDKPNQEAKKEHLIGVSSNTVKNKLDKTNCINSVPKNVNNVKDNMESKKELDKTNKLQLTEEQQSVFDTIATILKSGSIDIYRYKNNRRTGKADKDTLAEYVTKYDHDFLLEVAKYTIKKGTSFNYFISVVESNKDMTSDAFRESTKTKEERQQQAKQQAKQQKEQEQARLFQYALLSDIEIDNLCYNGVISLGEKQQIEQLKLFGGM